MTDDDWIEQAIERGRDLRARMHPGLMIEDADGTIRPVTMIEANAINFEPGLKRIRDTEAATAGDASTEASV